MQCNEDLLFLLQIMEGHEKVVLCLVVANRLMYSGGADNTARCWVTEFGDCTRHYKGHKQAVICMKFSKGIRKLSCFLTFHRVCVYVW